MTKLKLKESRRLLLSLGAIVVLGGGALSGNQQKQPPTVQKKGDLAILGCRTELAMVQETQNRHMIRLFVTVANLVPGTTTGTFILRTERRDHGGAWESHGQNTIFEKMSYGIADRSAPSKEYRFEGYVPIGKRYDYRHMIVSPGAEDNANPGNDTCETFYRTLIIGDGGGEETVIQRVDLVVSSVEVRRGMFGGSRKVQIIPVIRNMWHGRTNQRIRISIHELSLAWWIEGGIGGDQEKRGGAVYVDDPAGNAALSFSVVVDSANEIAENNEDNNTCGPIALRAGQASLTHRCPIVGPHGDLR